MVRFTEEELNKLTDEQRLQWENSSEQGRIGLEGMWRKFVKYDPSSSFESKIGNVDAFLGKNQIVNKEKEENGKLVEKLLKDNEELEKKNKELLLKSSRKNRPIPLATNVTVDIDNKIKFIMTAEGFKKKVDAIEKAIEEYFKIVSK